MKTLVMTSARSGHKAMVVGSLAALLGIGGCRGASEVPASTYAALPAAATQAALPAANQAGLPVVVSCAPTQRTIVRPAIVNGVAMSQVECVAAEPQAAGDLQPVARSRAVVTPVSYRTDQPADRRAIADTEVVPVPTQMSARPVRTNQAVRVDRGDDERFVRRRRSVQKSAVIIGSSSGIGAGVGAAVGGKKGALIGAVMGGGGAALWDQVTRRRD